MTTATEQNIMACKTSRAVARFMDACSEPRPEKPETNPKTGLWLSLIDEEYKELLLGFEHLKQFGDAAQYAEVLDACCDLVWVTIGLAHNMGLPFDAAFELVRITNMAKVDPTTGKVRRREDGKILKPENWVAPDITKLITEKLK